MIFDSDILISSAATGQLKKFLIDNLFLVYIDLKSYE